MKRLLRFGFVVGAILMAGAARAATGPRFQISSAIGPVYTSSTTGTISSVTIAAPASNQRNCITSLIVTSTNAFTPSVFDGSTQILATGTQAAASTFNKEWPFSDPLCATAGAALVIKSTGTASIGARQDFSYQGFVVQ